MEEIWKDIANFPNYQISNYGNVKIKTTNKIKKIRVNKNGYCDLKLHSEGKYKMFLLHRLVAQTFLPNPLGYNEINHKDGNKLNNNVDNLEWCSRSENVKHAYKKGLFLNQKEHLNKLHKLASKKVKQKTLDDVEIKIWDSIAQIERTLGYSHCVIGNCCLKKPHYLTAYGYKWEFAKGDD